MSLSNTEWRSIAYTNGKFVAVGTGTFGSNGSIAVYSTDGINWTASTLPSSEIWRSVTIGQINTLVEIQVSIGNQGEEGAEILAPVDVYTVTGIIETDIDEVTIKNNSGNTITYDLAVLNPGVELTDQNALINDQAVSAGATATITSITTPMTTGQRIAVFPSAVDVVEVKVYGTESALSAFYAVAADTDITAYSTDGINWTAATLPSPASWQSVTYGDGKFVAVTFGSDVAAYSTDGISWTASTLPSVKNWNSTTYGNGKFVAIAGYTGFAAYSTDGITWTDSTLPSFENWISLTHR
jgi:hypothetical protein